MGQSHNETFATTTGKMLGCTDTSGSNDVMHRKANMLTCRPKKKTPKEGNKEIKEDCLEGWEQRRKDLKNSCSWSPRKRCVCVCAVMTNGFQTNQESRGPLGNSAVSGQRRRCNTLSVAKIAVFAPANCSTVDQIVIRFCYCLPGFLGQ